MVKGETPKGAVLKGEREPDEEELDEKMITGARINKLLGLGLTKEEEEAFDKLMEL